MSPRTLPWRTVVAVALALAVVLVAPVAWAAGPKGLPTAQPLPGADPTVVAVFVGPDADHDCTASVVASPHGDVVIGAAHCVAGRGTDVTLAPAYRNGSEPYGRWQVIGIYAAPAWIAHQDPHDDFVFMTVAPRNGRSLQSVTGANLLGSLPTPGTVVTDTAYVGGSNDLPITCTDALRVSHGYPAFDCHGYLGGTSGSPFLQSVGGQRFVVGVIGGLHQGGCEEYTSFSSPFGDVTQQTYQRAATHQTPDVLPAAGSDGC